MIEAAVLTERVGHVLVITLNRPQAYNAVNLELAGLLGDALEELEASPDLRAAVVAGAGRAFCAGQDLKALANGEGLLQPGREHWGFAQFAAHPTSKPLVAAVHGFAMGGGLEIALACDLVVVAEGTRLGLPEVAHGLFAAGGGIPRIVHQLPPRIANRLLYTAEPIDAEEAARWGLVNEVVPADGVLDRALELATRIAENAPLAVQATKQLVTRLGMSSTSDPRTWEIINEEVARVFATEDAREGTRAFAEKRAPEWSGR